MIALRAAVLASGALAMLHPPAFAAPQDAHPSPAATPKAVPFDGAVIKPAGPVDPGIQAKTPPASHFPTPVIKPGITPAPPPR